MKPTYTCRIRVRAYTSSPASSVPVQRAIRAAYYRGGTSRAVIIHPQDLPSDQKAWPIIFRQLMGSGDPYGRQLDGMGAGISSLSKICLVESHTRDKSARSRAIDTEQARASRGDQGVWIDPREAHIDYTFVGLGIEQDEVDVAGNCGNMCSAIGPYAYNARLLPRQMYQKANGEVTVKIRNTNTGRFIDSTFAVVRRQASVMGEYAIDGVAGTGAKIKLDFWHPYGSKTGKVLPTGKKVDIVCGYRVTCVDGANPAVFIRADDIGVDGTILPNDLNKLPQKLELLERIRVSAAVAMGIAADETEVPRTIPKIGIVSMSSTHPVLSGSVLKTSQVDLVVRFISDTQPHRAIPLTAALTTAVAARIPGTIVEQLLAPDPVTDDAITIGHASGRIQVNATMDPKNPTLPLTATVYRTAKRLFEGNMYWVPDVEPTEERTGASRKKPSLGMAFVKASGKSQHGHPAETLVERHEDKPHPQISYAATNHEDHGGTWINSELKHAADVAVPALNLKPSGHPGVELPPSPSSPGPGLRSDSSELSPTDQTQHLYRGTVSNQAAGSTSQGLEHVGSKEMSSSSNYSEPRETFQTCTNHLQGLQSHRREKLDGVGIPDDYNEQQRSTVIVPANFQVPDSSVLGSCSRQQTIEQEMVLVKNALRALRMRLGALKSAHDHLHSISTSSEAVVRSASTEASENHISNTSVVDGNRRGSFTWDLAWRKARMENKGIKVVKEVGKHSPGKALDDTQKSSPWRLSEKGDSLDGDERVPGRRW